MSYKATFFPNYSILSLGTLNTKTGHSKYFNVYDEWKDSTAEIYKDVTRAALGLTDQVKFKIVFTSGSKPIKNRDGSDVNPADTRSFKDDQRGNYLFTGEFVKSCSITELKDCAAKLGIKGCTAYTYK